MLVIVPLRDQLDERTTDGQPDENARANCVPASLSAALSALTGRAYYGDALKDAVYGQAYTGATDPARYIAYLAAQGVRMWEVRSGSGDALVATIRAELALGHPVYGAIPSEWGITTAADVAAHGGPTHAVMFCDASPAAGTLTAMNPWPVDGQHAFYQTMPAAWWASRLVYGHVYPLAPGASAMPFTKQPDGSVRDDQTGVVLHLGMAAYVLAHTVQQHALLGETYYTPSDSFVPCGGGLILTYNKGENAVRADRGGETLLALWRQLASATARAEAAEGQARALGAQVATLQAELNAQQRTPVDPNDPAALAAIRALATALASLPPVAPAASEPAA
jgi:hypothetical protein